MALAQKAATRTRAEPGTDSGSDTDSRAGTIADAAARTSTRADTNACARTDAGAVARADADSNAGSGSQANTCADSDANTNACANSCADADSGAYTNTCAYTNTNTGTNTRAGSVVEHQPSNFRRGRCNDVRRLSNAARQRRQGRNVQRRFARGSTAIGHEPLSERNTFGWFSRCKPGRRGLVHLLRTRHLSFSGTPRTA